MSKNKKGDSSSSASIANEPLAPEMTVPKPLPTQSPAHELLSLLKNDKDFLDILFGKPSYRKARAATDQSRERVPATTRTARRRRVETKILLQVENGYQEKQGFGNRRLQKEEGTPKRNKVQIQEQQVSFASQEQPSNRVSQCRPQQRSVEFFLG
jgi:hypothetical protein